MNYAQAVTPHPFGPFARAALLTGVPSPENGVRDYFDPLPENTRTIAHDLGECGYATAWFGKWHLARRDPTAPLVGEAHARMIVPPEARGGFEFWEGFESGFLLNDPWLHGTVQPEPKLFPGYQADVLATRAAAWITGVAAAGRERPWFGVVSLESPHPPYAAPAAGVAVAPPESLTLSANVPRGGEVESQARRELAGYYAHIAATDRAVGRLIAALDAAATSGGEALPAVVFTSVHGDMHGAHGLFRKGWPYEESVRVPLLVRHPREAPRRSELPVSLLDVPVMTRAWAEDRLWVPPPERAHVSISMPSVVALPHQCDRVWSGTRSPHRKRVNGPDGAPWLEFNLRDDPLEMRNLVGGRAGGPEGATLNAQCSTLNAQRPDPPASLEC